MGLYFKFSIVLLYIILAVIYLINHIVTKRENYRTFKLFSLRRYFKYLKIFLNFNIISIIMFFSIISNSIIIYQNKKYEKLYNQKYISGEAIVVSNKIESKYYNKYKIKFKKTYLYLNLSKKFSKELDYGDIIKIEGEYIIPNQARNYMGFDYKEYLKTLKICGSVKSNNIEIIRKNQGYKIFTLANKIAKLIKNKFDENLNKEDASIAKGILLGETTEIEEKIQENFRVSNISHILAVSGMHVTYLIFGINIVFKGKLGKRKTAFLVIFFLIIYMFITGFSPSVVRAGIMGILLIFSKLLYRKNDILTSLSISIFLILIYNPFLIKNIGLQFSYIGTIGIILFYKNVYDFFNNIKNKKRKYIFNRKFYIFIDKIIEILSVSISVQITIIPIILFNFNFFSVYFLITNLLTSVIIGPIIIMCVAELIIPSVFTYILKLALELLILISKIGDLPFSKVYIPTPKFYQILIYYLCIFVLNFIYSIYHRKDLNNTVIRIRNLIALGKYKLKQKRRTFLSCVILIVIIILLFRFIPKKLKINFVDVGQGDCTFIVTPKNKTILIDGGGSSIDSWDVGKKILLPYILDRGYRKIDYIIVSHFDQDHVGGLFTVMEEIKVGKVIISKQGENSENYKKFKEIVKKNHINVFVMNKGETLKIEKDLYFDFLWPNDSKIISENILNNNSIVCKLNYKKFSMLFTGDIEEIAEKQILLDYKKNLQNLKSTILKVGHHGSKTSSIQEFIDAVKPKITLIGVGENNKFGHPNDLVIKRLEKCGSKIFRTDKNGEISIIVDKKGRAKIKKIIE